MKTKEKQKIDPLFKEKIKNFSTKPSIQEEMEKERVNISTKFEKFLKQNRRIKKRAVLYVSEDVHAKMQAIVDTVGELSLSDYVQNICIDHLSTFRSEINARIDERANKLKNILSSNDYN